MFKKVLLTVLIILTIVVILAVFIGKDTISEYFIKKIALQMEAEIGHKVYLDDVYISFAPFYIGINELVIRDTNQKEIVRIRNCKAYLKFMPLVYKKIVIHKLVFNDLFLDTNLKYIKGYIVKKTKKEDVNNYAFSFNVLSLAINNADIILKDERKKYRLTAGRISTSILYKPALGLNLVLKDITVDYREQYFSQTVIRRAQPVVVRLDSINFTIEPSTKEDVFKIKDIRVLSDGLNINSMGEAECKSSINDCTVSVSGDLLMDVEYIKKTFALKGNGKGKINASGNILFNGKDVITDLSVRGSFYLETLMELLRQKEYIHGEVKFLGDVNGPLKAIKGSGDVSFRKGDFFGVEVDTLECRIDYKDGEMRFSNGKGEFYGGSAVAEVMITLPRVDFFTLDIDVENVDSDRVFNLIEWHPGLSRGKVTGKIRSEGKQFNPEGWFEYSISQLSEENKDQSIENDNKLITQPVIKRIDRVAGKFSMNDKVLRLSDGVLSTKVSEGKFKGNVDLKRDLIDLEVSMKTDDVYDIAMPQNRYLRGNGLYEGVVTGKLSDPLLKGTIRLEAGRLFGVSFSFFKGYIEYSKEEFRIEKGTASTYGGMTELRGNIYFPDSRELFDFSEPDLYFEIGLHDLKTERIFSKLSANIGQWPDIKENKTSIDGNLRISGLINNLIYEGSFRIMNQNLLTSSGMKCNFNVKADHSKPIIFLVADINGKTARTKQDINGTISSVINGDGARFEMSLFNKKTHLSGKIGFFEEIPWSVNLEMKSYEGNEYDFIIKGLNKWVPQDMVLKFNSRITLKGNKNMMEGTAIISDLNLNAYKQRFENVSNIMISLETKEPLNINNISNTSYTANAYFFRKDIIFSFDAFNLQSNDSNFRIGGNLVLGKTYDLTLNGNYPLMYFKSISEKIHMIDGNSDFTLHIMGDWMAPEIEGQLKIKDGSLGMKNFRYFLSTINGDFSFEGNRIVISDLKARVGGGELLAKGVVYLDELKIKNFIIEGFLNNINAHIFEGFDMNISGEMLYKGSLNKQRLSGEMSINMARFTKNLILQDLIFKKISGQIKRTEASPFSKTELNIALKGDKDILINNNIISTSAKIDMILVGTISEPVLLGRVETNEGKIYFRNNEFEIINASIDFTKDEPLNPVIDLRSKTVVKGYSIVFTVEGRVERFNLFLSSNPPLAEMDIFSLLTVGKLSSDLKGLEGGIGVGETTSLLTGGVQDKVQSRVKELTGVDRIQISPYVTDDGTSVNPRVTVTKWLVKDKVNVNLTSTAGSSEEEMIKVEYLINKHVSLVGEKDDLGSIGGNIKFRFEFR